MYDKTEHYVFATNPTAQSTARQAFCRLVSRMCAGTLAAFYFEGCKDQDGEASPFQIEASRLETAACKGNAAENGGCIGEGQTDGGHGCDGKEYVGRCQDAEGRQEGQTTYQAHCIVTHTVDETVGNTEEDARV